MVGDDQVLVEHQLLAEAVAGGAGALGRVEAEEARLDLGDGEAGDRAGELLGEEDAAGDSEVELHTTLPLPPRGRGRGRGCYGLATGPPQPLPLAGGGFIGRVQIRQPFGQLERGLEAVGEARLDAFAHRHAVDDDLDVVLVFLVERRRVLDRVEFAVDADPGEARLLPLGELLAILPLAAADHRGEQIMARAFGQGHHPVDHLADLLRLDRQPSGGRVRHADPRPQQPHVIVDFGDRGDRRARVLRRRLLLDRDRRRQPVDMLDVGLLHHLQELARIGAQRLDVAPLPLGIDGVEGEAGFPGPGQPGDDRQRLPRGISMFTPLRLCSRAPRTEI